MPMRRMGTTVWSRYARIGSWCSSAAREPLATLPPAAAATAAAPAPAPAMAEAGMGTPTSRASSVSILIFFEGVGEKEPSSFTSVLSFHEPPPWLLPYSAADG